MASKKALAKARRRVRASARNALEIVRFGRLGEAYGAPYSVIDQGTHHRLRRYETGAPEGSPPALLVPPLMVTSEVYDVAPDVSAVAALGARGVQPYVIDFGAPEREAGGMKRTLDDHIRAVERAIDRVREIEGRDVHVLGYSQGGMFAYQSVAYRRGEGVKGIITFGSPVDIHRGLPAVRPDVTGALARLVEPAINKAFDRVQGLPGVFTSTAFKLLSPRKELQARTEFVKKLHDRNALVRREARRRFLGGEGFVAWPGPAFRVFFEEFIVHNRMLSGGFVIDGRTVTLADIKCPILCFVGTSDEIARPASVRAIAQAAPDAEVDEVPVPAGHFGLVVGSRAMQITWPTVAEWIHWREGTGPKPQALTREVPKHIELEIEDDEDDPGELDLEFELFLDTAAETMRTAWRRLGDVVASASDALDAVRWQEPRLRRLAELSPGDRISPSQMLADQAKASPDATFFLWRDRAFTFREADLRVSNVVRGLWSVGVRPGDRVGVVMGSRPSFLSMVTALGRLGAVAVVAPPEAADGALSAALERAGATRVASDPEHGPRLARALGRDVLVLGGGGKARSLPGGIIDLEAVDPAHVELPADFDPDSGRAREVGMILLRPSESGELREAPVTNHRWALSALGAAAACTLTPQDTVYCCIPLHHPTGVLVSVGSALVSGSRLALGESFDPHTFAPSVRRAGASVVFYAGEMLRALLAEQPSRGDRTLPVRLFAGSGMRPDLAARLRERFGVGVMEFYASTSHRVILANASGEKPGALGHLLPGSAPIALVRWDPEQGGLSRDEQGLVRLSKPGEPGLLASKLDEEADTFEGGGVVHDVLEKGDRWFLSNDVLRQDDDGDFWFVDARAGFVQTPAGPVSTRKLEDALHTLPEIDMVVAWGSKGRLEAAFTSRTPIAPARLAEVAARLEPHERPALLLRVETIPLTDGFRPRRREVPRTADRALEAFRLDEAGVVYR